MAVFGSIEMACPREKAKPFHGFDETKNGGMLENKVLENGKVMRTLEMRGIMNHKDVYFKNIESKFVKFLIAFCAVFAVLLVIALVVVLCIPFIVASVTIAIVSIIIALVCVLLAIPIALVINGKRIKK